MTYSPRPDEVFPGDPDLLTKLDELRPSEFSRLVLPEVVLYEHINFNGQAWRTNIGWLRFPGGINDQVSSIIVVAGEWCFYEHVEFNGGRSDGYEIRLTPGYYPNVANFGIKNDSLSSVRIVAM